MSSDSKTSVLLAAAGALGLWLVTLLPPKWQLFGFLVVAGLVVAAVWVSDWEKWTRVYRVAASVFAVAVAVAAIWVSWPLDPVPFHSFQNDPPQIARDGRLVVNVKFSVNSDSIQVRRRGFVKVVPRVTGDESEVAMQRQVWNELSLRPYNEPRTMARGDVLISLYGDVVTPDTMAAIKRGDLQPFMVGQLEYGSGVVEMCVFWRPQFSTIAHMCREHNGPAR